MAFRAVNYWRTMMNRMGETRQTRALVTSTVPKMKPSAPTVDAAHINQHNPLRNFKADFFPVYMVLGLITAAVAMAAHTAKQQLMYSPSVQVSKKKREILSEVEQPDYVVAGSDKFVNKSFLRKVAHIQEADAAHTAGRDPEKSVFTHGRDVETLKMAGVNPRTP